MQTKHHKIVLHIDDDSEDREMVRDAIHSKHSDIIVKEIDNPKAGVSYLLQAKYIGNLPCLIVLDLNLPGMNGWQVLQEIKKDKVLASIPLVIFSMSSNPLDKAFAEKEGVEFLTKPPTPNELNERIEKLLGHC
jgi:CheY-like chemotaxis protein